MGFMFVKRRAGSRTPEEYGYTVTKAKEVSDEDIGALYLESREMSGNIISELEKYLPPDKRVIGGIAVKQASAEDGAKSPD